MRSFSVAGYSVDLGIASFLGAASLHVTVLVFYVFALFVGFRTEVSWYLVLPVMALVAVYAWRSAVVRAHVMGDTPTARVRSAAQGYVELIGTAGLIKGDVACGFGMLPPCLWYRVRITERSHGSRSGHTQVRQSDDTFELRDGSDTCVIDPDGAEVIAMHSKSWSNGGKRYSAKYIMEGDALYAIGELTTERGADGGFDLKAGVREKLRDWKQNQAGLLQRFDTDGSGHIDQQEWAAAVTQAEREVGKINADMLLEPGIHIMRAPSNGKPYILSNRDPDEIAQRFRYWSYAHALGFISAVVAAIILLT